MNLAFLGRHETQREVEPCQAVSIPGAQAADLCFETQDEVLLPPSLNIQSLSAAGAVLNGGIRSILSTTTDANLKPRDLIFTMRQGANPAQPLDPQHGAAVGTGRFTPYKSPLDSIAVPSPTLVPSNTADACRQCTIFYKSVSVYYPPPPNITSNTDCLTDSLKIPSPTNPLDIRL